MFMMLKRRLHEGIKPPMVEQISTMENIFLLKMETLLNKRILAMVKTKTNHMDQVCNHLEKKNMRL